MLNPDPRTNRGDGSAVGRHPVDRPDPLDASIQVRGGTNGRVLYIASKPDIHHETRNPYFRLMYGALAGYGIEHRGEFQLNNQWLRQNATALDALHIHWPEHIWRLHDRTRLRRIWWLIGFLRLARSFGIQRVWTVHNLPPHEIQAADLGGLWMLAREIDLFVCHSNDVASRLHRWLRPPRSSATVLMRLGNYDGVYPPPRDPERFAQASGIPLNKPIVTVLGMLRAYKGLDVALEAARLLRPLVHLVIAGTPMCDIADLRRAAAASADHVTLIAERLSDQNVSNLLHLSEMMWLPYHRISSSSAVLLSLTASRGVIASDLPFFREILDGAVGAGRLVRPSDPVAIAEATREYLKVPADERSRAAREVADRYAWEQVVKDFASALKTRARKPAA
jgi:beta-1,4-mannosyltransferase